MHQKGRDLRDGPRSGWIGGWRRLPKRLVAATVGYKWHWRRHLDVTEPVAGRPGGGVTSSPLRCLPAGVLTHGEHETCLASDVVVVTLHGHHPDARVLDGREAVRRLALDRLVGLPLALRQHAHGTGDAQVGGGGGGRASFEQGGGGGEGVLDPKLGVPKMA